MTISLAHNVFGGPRPKLLAELRDHGIKRIINLESGVYDTLRVYTETYYEDSLQFPPDFGMVEYMMPCSDITPPPEKIVSKILELVQDKTPTYIHCYSGVDRTGFVAAAIRMRLLRWSYDDALKAWREIRHPWYFYWERALRKWA